MAEDLVGLHIWVRGIVQGVGFRPFVYTLATRLSLTGWVRNTSNGVEIVVNGKPQAVSQFSKAIKSESPPLARVDQIEFHPLSPDHYERFEILFSKPEPGEFIPISPDISICPDCRRELFDPSDRRFRYPFINCTNCGPRFSIIRDIPYDRPNTTMGTFKMCSACQAEYDNPLNRRFHAQPTACPECGPQLNFHSNGSNLACKEEALQLARHWLANGKIIAIKGLGGYLLACDALNKTAVDELRYRKKRIDKPFALMAFDLAAIDKHCEILPAEYDQLLAPASPIVLLNQRTDSKIATSVAPNQHVLGFMLPYTPLHMLLLEPAPGFSSVLVMTSGNLSEEPISYRDDEAFEHLSGIADGFLTHDRDIHMRIDDSVIRVIQSRPYPLRRARGFSPMPITIAHAIPQVLATGAELKNTFCLTRDHYAFLSHHIGDMENLETLLSFEEGVRHYEQLFRIHPALIACDLHPDYLTTRYAQQRAVSQSLPVIQVQHHHAHLAACLADNNWTSSEPAIGLCFDGTGLGTDGAIWGGEILLGGYKDYQRLYHFSYTPLVGGDVAIRYPARMALAHLFCAGLDWEAELPPVAALSDNERAVLRSQLERRINSPLTSSLGRLFDAVSALMDVRHIATYEGQAAIELEALCDPLEQGTYEIAISGNILDTTPMWWQLINDWRKGVSRSIMAARFHNALVEVCQEVCQKVKSRFDVKTIALSGGVWQNRFLLEKTITKLKADGFEVLWHQRVPPNDGGIALGQALIASHILK